MTTTKRIELIPVAQIRVVNPRSRNQKTFRGIVTNIGMVGLKKPITVFRRQMEADGTQYDLVCGQGRLEAVAALGGTDVPAVSTDASLKDRYLMSLVENIARKRPPLSELLQEVRSLKKRGYRNAAIADKLGMGKTYVDGIVQLLNQGEDRLVEQVEAGTIPLNVAINIATSGKAEVQRALSEAYDKGELRGAKLVAIQRLLSRRAASSGGQPETQSARPTSSRDLVKQYERHTQRQRALVKRAAVVHERLALIIEAFKRLLADRSFASLLREEGLGKIPTQLVSRAS